MENVYQEITHACVIWVGKVLIALRTVGVTVTVLVTMGPEFVTFVKVS